MQAIQDFIYNTFETLTFGIANGPLGRGSLIFAITSGIIYFFKPGFAYDSNGEAKSFVLFSNGPNTTTMPWWLPGVLLGLFTGLFI